MVLELSIALVILGGIATWWWKRRPPDSNEQTEALPPQPLDGSGRFRAVSIRFGPGSCNASRALHGRRFLNAAAPELPLADCDRDDCQCRFVHHRDRRSGNDRRTPFQEGYGGTATRVQDNRREVKDRRKNPPS